MSGRDLQADVHDRLKKMLDGDGAAVLGPAVATATQSGRGPSGKLRNFAAMGDAKLLSTLDDVRDEDNDHEAFEALVAEADRRSL
jgi:hypothetical protein